MNYSEALAFVFRDQDWVKKIAIGGFVAFVSFYCGLVFIFGFFLVGYYLGIIRNLLNNEESPLPEWSDVGKIFIDGLVGSIIIFVYTIFIGGLCAMFIVYLANHPFISDFERVIGIIFVSISTLVSLAMLINLGLLRFATTENFGSAFDVAAMFELIKQNFGNLLAITIFSLILNAILLAAGFGILSPFTNFWGLTVQAHLFAQLAKGEHIAKPATSAMQSAQ